jgi:hypothetical protein
LYYEIVYDLYRDRERAWVELQLDDESSRQERRAANVALDICRVAADRAARRLEATDRARLRRIRSTDGQGGR